MVNIGVIGAGAWGLNLIRNVALGPSTELVAVCDPREEARRIVASRYRRATTHAKLDGFLNTPSMDAVIIATPPCLHFEHARIALEAGFHVLVEKPLCTNSQDAAELVRLADERNLVLMVGHTFLYNNLVEEVKRRIDCGDLGEVRYMYSQRLNLGRVRTDVDALWNLAPHDISIANYIQNARPVTVNARGASYIRTKPSIADVAFFQLDYAGGQLFSGHVSWLDPHKARRTVVVGSERMLVYDDMDPTQHIQLYDKRIELEFQSPLQDFADFTTRVKAGDLVIPSIRLKEPLAVEIEHFGACVCDGLRPKTDGKVGLEMVRILEAMTESMRMDGAMVEVDYSATRTEATAPVTT